MSEEKDAHDINLSIRLRTPGLRGVREADEYVARRVKLDTHEKLLRLNETGMAQYEVTVGWKSDRIVNPNV